jgi:hypothetical protein
MRIRKAAASPNNLLALEELEEKEKKGATFAITFIIQL